MWLLYWSLLFIPFWHISHQNINRPVWTDIWYFRPLKELNVFPHFGQHRNEPFLVVDDDPRRNPVFAVLKWCAACSVVEATAGTNQGPNNEGPPAIICKYAVKKVSFILFSNPLKIYSEILSPKCQENVRMLNCWPLRTLAQDTDRVSFQTRRFISQTETPFYAVLSAVCCCMCFSYLFFRLNPFRHISHQ